jgi:hypothetical protein
MIQFACHNGSPLLAISPVAVLYVELTLLVYPTVYELHLAK